MAKQRASDVMTPNPKAVTASDNILEVARIMRDQDTGVVPVVEGKRVIGVVTDRDIVVRAVADGKDCSQITVSQAMTRNIRTVKDDTPVDEILKIMSNEDIRRVPVVNNGGELVGIISIGDVAMRTSKEDKVGQVVENISKASPNN